MLEILYQILYTRYCVMSSVFFKKKLYPVGTLEGLHKMLYFFLNFGNCQIRSDLGQGDEHEFPRCKAGMRQNTARIVHFQGIIEQQIQVAGTISPLFPALSTQDPFDLKQRFHQFDRGDLGPDVAGGVDEIFGRSLADRLRLIPGTRFDQIRFFQRTDQLDCPTKRIDAVSEVASQTDVSVVHELKSYVRDAGDRFPDPLNGESQG